MTGRRPIVLIIDDVDDQRDLLAELFRRAGCDIVPTAGTAEAEKYLGGDACDIAVVDLMLSGPDDGWTALQSVRRLAPEAAVVICSVLDVSHFPPADAYLPKPITLTQVRDLVEQLAPSS
jgi:CheY-like chemotaxis protein